MLIEQVTTTTDSKLMCYCAAGKRVERETHEALGDVLFQFIDEAGRCSLQDVRYRKHKERKIKKKI